MPYQLTPNAPDPLTGLTTVLLAWHFVPADALDIFAALPWLKTNTSWDYHLYADPDNPSLQVLELLSPLPGDPLPGSGTIYTAAGAVPAPAGQLRFLIHNTDYFAFDGAYMRKLANADVSANYTITQVPLPTAPAPATPAAAPADITPPDTTTTTP